jgi:hypothetical protein
MLAYLVKKMVSVHCSCRRGKPLANCDEMLKPGTGLQNQATMLQEPH